MNLSVSCQFINQSINQSVSIQSLSRSISQSVNQSNNQSISQSINFIIMIIIKVKTIMIIIIIIAIINIIIIHLKCFSFLVGLIPPQFLHNQLALTKLGRYLPVSIGLTSIVMISTEEGTCTVHAKKFCEELEKWEKVSQVIRSRKRAN